MKRKIICLFFAFVLGISSVPVSVQAASVLESKVVDEEVLTVDRDYEEMNKVPYTELLPEVASVSEAELERIESIAKNDINLAITELNAREDREFIPILKSLLDIYYADIQNPDMDSIAVLKEGLHDRADEIFAGYDAALEERLSWKKLGINLGYEPGKVIMIFEENTSYKDVIEIANRLGASIHVVSGTGISNNLSDYMAADSNTDDYFVTFDFGIRLSAPMAFEILQKIDCVEIVELNVYILVDTESDKIDKSQQNTVGIPVTPELKQDIKISHTEQNRNEQEQNIQISAKQKESLEKNTVYVVSKLKYKVLDEQNKEVSLIGSTNKNMKKLNVKATVVINGVKCKIISIEKNAFKNKKNLTEVILGKNISSIGKNAFTGCSKLKNIKVKSKNLKSLNKNAFQNIHKSAVVFMAGK